MHMKYNAYEVCELLLFVFDMGYDKKKYSFFSSNYEQGGNKYVPKCNHTFFWHPPSMMQLRVSHYYGDVILHFTKSGGMNKPDRYLPMREAEFVALLSMVDEINKQIKKTKKIAQKERQNLDDESDINFTQVPLPPMQKKRPNKCPAPSSDSNDSLSCGEEAVEGPSMGKGGGKKLKLAKKKKAKKMEKENDLVGSSQGSDSQLSEAGDK